MELKEGYGSLFLMLTRSPKCGVGFNDSRIHQLHEHLVKEQAIEGG